MAKNGKIKEQKSFCKNEKYDYDNFRRKIWKCQGWKTEI